jgi:hypothetical protein
MQFTSKTRSMPDDFKVKFYFDDSDKSSGIELKFITDEEKRGAYKELVREDIEFAVHPVNKKLTKVVTPDVDPEAIEAWFIDKMIAGWFGVFLDGEEIKCTKENKVKLYKEQEVFRDFVDECNAKLTEQALESFGSSSKAKNS